MPALQLSFAPRGARIILAVMGSASYLIDWTFSCWFNFQVRSQLGYQDRGSNPVISV